MQQKSSGGMPAKRFIALIALVALAVAVIVFAVREIRLYGDVQVEQSRTPTPVPGYGNVMQVTIDPSLPTPVPVLRSGAQGEAVWQLQERLQALGYLTGSVDGQFGPATKEAVQLFQRQHGLTAETRRTCETLTKLSGILSMALAAAGKISPMMSGPN